MRATPLIIASLLSLGTFASAMAMGTSAAGTAGANGYNCTNQSIDHAASHESASTGGDALNIPHASNSVRTSSTSHSASSNTTDENSSHFGGSDATSSGSAHSSGLGWQSLLPGSIQ
jgi:hypothetical protein